MLKSKIPYESFLSSDAFHVKGPSGKSFFAHSALLAKNSRVLDKAINGSMREAEERQISLIDVDGDFDDATVMRFIEFAYTGSYSLPDIQVESRQDASKVDTAATTHSPSTNNSKTGNSNTSATAAVTTTPSNPPVQGLFGNSTTTATTTTSIPTTAVSSTPASAYSGFGTSGFGSNNAPQGGGLFGTPQPAKSLFGQPAPAPAPVPIPTKRQQLWSKFTSLAYTIRSEPWEPRLVKKNLDVFTADHLTADLICHAQLYVFAHRYECVDLTIMTMQRLRLTLARIDTPRCLNAVIELLVYTYTHTHDYQFGCDQLRTLVVDFVVCHLEKFVAHLKFKELLRQEGAFADDLLTKTMARLET